MTAHCVPTVWAVPVPVPVLDPTDDLTMTHEAFFVNKETGHVRKAWVFRWLQSARLFSKDSGKRAVDDVE